MSHFRRYGFVKWDSMISLMWDSTSVSQKCVVGHGLWDRNCYLQGFSVVMQNQNAVTADGVIDDDNGVLTCKNCLFLEME